MSTQSASADPSMEEILASIRQIISDGDDGDVSKNETAKEEQSQLNEQLSPVNEVAEGDSFDFDAEPAIDPMVKLQNALFGHSEKEAESDVLVNDVQEEAVAVAQAPIENAEVKTNAFANQSFDTYKELDLTSVEISQPEEVPPSFNLEKELTDPDMLSKPEEKIDFTKLQNPFETVSSLDELEDTVATDSRDKSFGQSMPKGDASSHVNVTNDEISQFSNKLNEDSSVSNSVLKSNEPQKSNEVDNSRQVAAPAVAMASASVLGAGALSASVSSSQPLVGKALASEPASPMTAPPSDAPIAQQNMAKAPAPAAPVQSSEKAIVADTAPKVMNSIASAPLNDAPKAQRNLDKDEALATPDQSSKKAITSKVEAPAVSVETNPKPAKKQNKQKRAEDISQPKKENVEHKERIEMASNAQKAVEIDTSLVSSQVEVETRDAFKMLSKALMPENGQRNFEDVVSELLRPLMKEWMDQNFPALVERLVKEEIQRLSK